MIEKLLWCNDTEFARTKLTNCNVETPVLTAYGAVELLFYIFPSRNSNSPILETIGLHILNIVNQHLVEHVQNKTILVLRHIFTQRGWGDIKNWKCCGVDCLN